MISTLHGILFEKSPSSVIIECGGVGYEAFIPISVYSSLPAAGEECRLFVRHVVREDDELLFGFASKGEREIFDLLLGISGVGPKLAICVLGGMTTDEFKRCIAEGDAKRLGTVKGIGKKTAERIVVELRGKIDPIEALAVHTIAGMPANDAVIHDTILALTQLGFQQEAARKMVQAALDSGADATKSDELLRKALANR